MNDWERGEPLVEDALRLLKRGLLPALIVAIAAGLSTYYLSRRQPPTYESETTLIATQAHSELQALGVSSVTARPLSASAYEAAVLSTPVLADALTFASGADATVDAIQDLRGRTGVATEVDPAATLIEISVRARTAEGASNLTTAVTNAVLAWDAARAQRNLDLVISTLEEQVAALDAQLAGLDPSAPDFENQRTGVATLRAQQRTQLSSVQALRNSAVGALEVIEPATTPVEPIAPRPTRTAAILFLLGAFLVYAVLLLREAVSKRLTSASDLARVTGAPVLAVIEAPPEGRGATRDEALTYLRTNLHHAPLEAHPRTILITGASHAEGKARIAIGLAESFSRAGQRTLLVDADMRKPSIAAAYGLRTTWEESLNACLEGHEGGAEPMRQLIALSQGALHVVHAEEADHASLVESLSRGFARCLDAWRTQYDVIIVDTPPLLYFADALTIAPAFTGAVLVVDKATADRRDVRAAAELLQRVDAELIGTVMTGADKKETWRRGRRAYLMSGTRRRRKGSTS